MEPVTIAIGALVGAFIGYLWSDPHRDSRGRYKTHKSGFESWIFQTLLGGFLGAIVTPFVVGLTISIPVITVPALLIGAYLLYVKKVDPR